MELESIISLIGIGVAIFFGVYNIHVLAKIEYEKNKAVIIVDLRQVGKYNTIRMKNIGNSAATITDVIWKNKAIYRKEIIKELNNGNKKLFELNIGLELYQGQFIQYKIPEGAEIYHSGVDMYEIEVKYLDFKKKKNSTTHIINFSGEGLEFGPSSTSKSSQNFGLKELSKDLNNNLVQGLKEISDKIN